VPKALSPLGLEYVADELEENGKLEDGSMRSAAVLTMMCLTAGSVWAGLGSQRPAVADGLPAGVKGGLVVHVAGKDVGAARRTVGACAAGPHVVHFLYADASDVSTVRKLLRDEGVGGRMSAAHWTGGRLPYVDNLVNLLLVEPGADLSDAEALRVTAPGGVVCVRRGATWTRRVKPRPAGMDEWTHHLYNAGGINASGDTLVAQPRSMQWKAGPEYSRSHENMASVSAVVSAGGRVFAIMDEGPVASIYLPPRWFLSARDAFSGVLLWKVPIREWHARLFPLKSGPQQLPRRLVATTHKVYATLALDAPVTELDAAGGEALQTFDATEHAEELLYVSGRLIAVCHDGQGIKPYAGNVPRNRSGFSLREKALNPQADKSILVLDPVGGKVLWKTPSAPVASLAVAADAEGVYCVRGGELVCAELADGRTRWHTAVARKAAKSSTVNSPEVMVHQGVVYLAMARKLSAYDARSGKALWSAPCAAAGYRAPPSIHIVGGLIWDVDTGGEPYRPGTDPKKINRYYTGYDLRTGEVRKKLPVSGDHGYAIMHHRCHIPRAAGDFLITSFPGIELFNVKTGSVTHDSWIRGACLYGFMPANGLLYTPPHPCACYTQGKLTGFWAVAGERKSSRPSPDAVAERLTKGPAFGRKAGRAAGEADWPTYRGDPARTGTTTCAIAKDVAPLWQAKVGRGLSQCVIAGGRLLVATVDDHTVHALHAADGKALWHFTAGGRVDSPPTVHEGTVLFGSRDGYVYCLTAEAGELVWRFRAAPIDERGMAYDQVESVWPVHGSVLVREGVLWCCAGRSSYLDGGLVVYRLETRSGRVLSTTKVDSLGKADEQRPITPTMYARLDMEGAKNDVLSADAGHVFMRHWAFDADGKSVPRTVDHLFSPTGFLDASWFRRTYWIYGRIYVSGAQGWARTGNSRPTGRILSIDGDRIYGFGRNFYPPSPGARDQMYLRGEQEMFFAAARTATPGAGPAKAPPRRAKGRRKPNAGKPTRGKAYLWSVPGDLQVRGMVLAGPGEAKRLFAVGARGDWVTSRQAYEGKMGSVLRVLSVTDGKTLAERELPGLPVFDGLSAANGRLYLSLADGRVVCLAPTKP